jgi:hypothetical protein
VIYGAAVLLALYVDYSAAYALAPQIFLLALVTRRDGRRALALWAAALAAALGFLPWLPQVFSAAGAAGSALAWFLGADPSRIADSLLAITGLSGRSSYYGGDAATPWVRWPAAHAPILIMAAPAALLGAVALVRRRGLAPVLVAGLLCGTVGAATLVSLVSPGYADRTVLYAVVGWAILVGAAPFVPAARWLRVAGAASLAGLLVLSTLSLGALYQGASKQPYRDFAAETTVAAALGLPVLTTASDDVTETLITVYQPGALASGHLQAREGRVAAALAQGGDPAAVWFAHADYNWTDASRVGDQLVSLGYARILRRTLPDPLSALYLDLYARPGAQLGVAVPLDAAAPGGTIDVPVSPHSLLTLDFETRATAPSAQPGITLACLSAGGATLASARSDAVAPGGAGGSWQAARVATLCPGGTARARITMRGDGAGYRDLRLGELTPRRR